MEWWVTALVTVGALAILFTIRGAWHGYRCPACRSALRIVRDRHPDWRVCGSTHRAMEPGRQIVAVFYQPCGHGYRPIPYRLVAVDRASGAAEEMPDDPWSPYAFKNYR